jgi:lysine biosynthesis protein LysW
VENPAGLPSGHDLWNGTLVRPAGFSRNLSRKPLKRHKRIQEKEIMNRSSKSTVAFCPSCAAPIYFSRRPRLGEIIVCGECDEDLEVVRLSPIELEWSFLDGDEDWADVNFEYYEDGDDRSDDYQWN